MASYIGRTGTAIQCRGCRPEAIGGFSWSPPAGGAGIRAGQVADAALPDEGEARLVLQDAHCSTSRTLVSCEALDYDEKLMTFLPATKCDALKVGELCWTRGFALQQEPVGGHLSTATAAAKTVRCFDGRDARPSFPDCPAGWRNIPLPGTAFFPSVALKSVAFRSESFEDPA
jgi:hypothetical protein